MRAASFTVFVLVSAAVVDAADPDFVRRRPRRLATSDSGTSRGKLIRPVSFASGLSEDWPNAQSGEATDADKDEDDEKPKNNYGPPPDEPRKTLFQWSYGTSFGGGVDLDDDLQTDRPDFVEASTTVGKGVLQIESGYTYIRNKDVDDNSITHSAGEFLFRYGVYEDWLELRLGVFPFSQVSKTPPPAVSHSGVEDLYLGVKLGLTPQEGWWPEMALVPQMTIPTGARSVTANEVLPGINWLYGWDVNDFLGVGASTQFNNALDGGTGHKYTEWAQAITINYNLTKKVGAYTEWFGFFPSGADTEQVQHYMDAGFTYRPTHDTQFDIRAGIGLTGASDDYFIGTGYSIRIK